MREWVKYSDQTAVAGAFRCVNIIENICNEHLFTRLLLQAVTVIVSICQHLELCGSFIHASVLSFVSLCP